MPHNDRAPRDLSLSIVSHGQAALIAPLLNDLRRLALSGIEVLITVNIPENETPFLDLPFPSTLIRNESPKGFGENHNAAFRRSAGRYFVVVNPDVRLPSLNVEQLLEPMRDPKVGVIAPVVLNGAAGLEDSVRRFPTVAGLARRVILKQRVPGYQWGSQPIDVDWAAGMFLVFRREAYAAVHGFDQRRFFMYFEDVDISRRLRSAGWRVVLQPAISVIHDAQRASHRSLKHLRWHVTSAIRYFTGL